MPEWRNLTDREARAIVRPGLHRLTDDGLFLQVRADGRRGWVFCYVSPGGKTRRKMGLGSCDAVTFRVASREATAAAVLVEKGVDPIELKQAEAAARQPAVEPEPEVLAVVPASEVTAATMFKEAAESYIALHAPTWRNPKHRAQWGSTLEAYAFPAIGEKPVAEVTTADVLAILAPIWTAKPETASRLRGRIERIIASAIDPDDVRPNPASLERLRSRLPMKRARAVQHHKAMPIDDVPEFMARLSVRPALAARALEFTVLTACRTTEVLAARWSEVDTTAGVWIIPAERMKAGREHRVPLTAAVLKVLDGARIFRDTKAPDLVFPGERGKSHLSNMAMLKVLERMGVDATAHGFRSTFRDWAAERTDHQHEVAEAALAHVIANRVEAAYRRGTMFEKRRALMDDWAVFCSSFVGEVDPVARDAETVVRVRVESRKTLERKARLARLRAAEELAAGLPVKRGRGRPRKVDPLDETPTPPKRPRGRPRKAVNPLDTSKG